MEWAGCEESHSGICESQASNEDRSTALMPAFKSTSPLHLCRKPVLRSKAWGARVPGITRRRGGAPRVRRVQSSITFCFHNRDHLGIGHLV